MPLGTLTNIIPILKDPIMAVAVAVTNIVVATNTSTKN